MLPEKITISKIEKVDGEHKEVSRDYFFKFNFNSINEFRKVENIEFSEFNKIFGGLETGSFDSVEKVGLLFYYALKEGCRIMSEDFNLTPEDVLIYINESAENFTGVIDGFTNAQPKAETDKKKVKESP